MENQAFDPLAGLCLGTQDQPDLVSLYYLMQYG